MSDETNTAQSNLSITEDAFDEFAASSMYEEDEYITLSDIAVSDDPVTTQPAPEITEMSIVDDLVQPNATEFDTDFINGIKSTDPQETIENRTTNLENTNLEPHVNENYDNPSNVCSGRPKRNRLKRNIHNYLSDYTSDDEGLMTKSNGVPSKKPKLSSSGRGGKKSSKVTQNNRELDSSFDVQNNYCKPTTESSKKSVKQRGKPGRPKRNKVGRPKIVKNIDELQNNEQSIDIQPQPNNEKFVSNLAFEDNINSILNSNINNAKGSGRHGKKRKKLSDTNSVGSADIASVSNTSLNESIANASEDHSTANVSVVNTSVENAEVVKPLKRGKKKKVKAEVENIEQPILETARDYEKDIVLSHIGKIKEDFELNSTNFDDDKDDLCLSKLKETLDNNVASDIEIDETVVTNAVVDVSTNENENLLKADETQNKRNSKPLVNTDYEYNVDSVVTAMMGEISQNEEVEEDPYLIEDKSKRPSRRKVRKVMRYEEDSDEDPYANVELSDDEPRRKKKGNKDYSDDEYVPNKEKGTKIISSEGSDSDIDDDDDDELLKPLIRRSRNTSTNKSPKKKTKTQDVIIDVKTVSPKSINVEDDIENCLTSSIIITNEDGKPKTMANEFENFIAKKIHGTDLKIKKVSSSDPTQSASLEIPYINPNEPKKYLDISAQTDIVTTKDTGMQTTSSLQVTVDKNAPLSTELSEKACNFLKNVVKTTSELGQLMTEKSEDFITKKINTSHVTDVSKMDYCVKKSFLLFKLAKHNLVQMEEDLANQYEKFLTENGLQSCLAKTKMLTPKAKAADDDSDCEIVEGPVVATTARKKKPAFNPKTVFLNKELSIKIAKKPNAPPKTEEKAKINVKGRHSVWISDSVMVKKVKTSQSFLAQDSRNKKPPDSFVTDKMVSDFFNNYYRQQAQRICAPFISPEWSGFNRNYVCCYFFVKSDKYSGSNMRNSSDEEYCNSNGHNSSNENLIKITQSPQKLTSLCLKTLEIYFNNKTENGHQAVENKNSYVKKNHIPDSLFRMCYNKITKSIITHSIQDDYSKIEDTVVQRQEVLPLKSLCYEKVNNIINKLKDQNELTIAKHININYRHQAQKNCPSFISPEWSEFNKNHVCSNFFLKSDKFSGSNMRNSTDEKYCNSNEHNSSNENLIKISHGPEKLISLSLKTLQIYRYKITDNSHKVVENKNSCVEKNHFPNSLFRLCYNKITDSTITDSIKDDFSKIEDTVVCRREVWPLKSLCYENVNYALHKNNVGITCKLKDKNYMKTKKYNSEVEKSFMNDSSVSTCSDDIFAEIDNLLEELDTCHQNHVKSLVSLCIDCINHNVKEKLNGTCFVNKIEQRKVLENISDSRYHQTPKSLQAVSLENIQRHLFLKNSVLNIECIETNANITLESASYNENVEVNAAKLNTLLMPSVAVNNVRKLADICLEVVSKTICVGKASLNEEEATKYNTSENSVHQQKVKTLAEICFETISKITNNYSFADTEGGINIALTINSVNTLSEEAFHNIEDEYTEQDNLDEQETAFYSDIEYDAALSDNEDIQPNKEPEDSNWVSQVQLKELKSCFFPSKNNTDRQVTPNNMHDEQIIDHPVMVHIKEEPADDICDSMIDSSIVKTEPNLDEMTMIPDSIVTKQEHIESEPRDSGTAAHAGPIRRDSSSYDMDAFESFVASSKIIYAVNETGCNIGDIYTQSTERIRRQYDPDSDNEIENFESDSLLVPHTFEPIPVETAKNSLMKSSSEDEATKKADGKKKLKKKKPSKKPAPLPKTKATIPPPPSENELNRLTRRMKEKIRQEEKKLKSSDEEGDLPANIKKDKNKDNEKAKPKTIQIDSEIQVNNVDSTEQVDISQAEEKFTGFTSIDQNEISNYQKYAKFVYDKILPKVTGQSSFAELPTTSSLDKKIYKSDNRSVSPVIDFSEPVEMLECEPTMPVFDDDQDKPKSAVKLRGPKRFAKKKDEQAVTEQTAKIVQKYMERDGWHCYPINLTDVKLLRRAEIVLEKLPESFVDTYSEYQDVTQAQKEDEEINRLINMQTLINRGVSREVKSKPKSKSKAVNDDQIAHKMTGGASPSSEHMDELTPSEDEHGCDDEMPPPVSEKSSENNLAKNLLMNDNDSDSDGATTKDGAEGENIKKEKDDDMVQPRPKRRGKPKEPEVPEHQANLMLTADKMMNKELNLLHAPVSLTNELVETMPKDSSTKRTRNAPRRSCNKNLIKAEDDSSSEEEKQWVSTKEKLLKRMGKKNDTALMDDAKRAKLVTEFIERRGDACESRKTKKRGGRGMSRKHRLEREKQLRVLSKELYGESSADMIAVRTKFSQSYFKGRRNIRAVIDKKSLQRSTVLANMEEFERKCRLNQRQGLLRDVLRCEEDVNVVVIDGELCLEYDFEDRKPVVSVHPFFTKVMKAHQYEGVKFMWDACFESIEKTASSHPGGGCILAHCMGLGKTLQVLALLHTVLTHPQVGMQRVLVCCPLSTVLNWVDEIHKWIGPVTDQIKVFELSKLKKTYERAYQLEDWYNGGGIFIIGYELFRSLSTLDPDLDNIRPTILNKIRTALLDPGPDIIVCDEGHLLKNDSSVLAVAMSRVITKRRIVLTGTPMQNNLREYYCMVNFVKPNLLGTYAEYSNRFENPIMNGQHRDSQQEDIKLMKQRTHILHKVLEGCLQRQEASVLYPYLPKKHEYTVFISQTQCQWDLYKHYLQNYGNQTTKHTNILKDFHILQKIWSHPHVLHNFQMRAKIDKLKTEKLEDDLAREDLASEDIKPSETEVWWLQYLDGGNMLDTLESSNKFGVVFSILNECVRLGDKVLIFSTSLVTLDSLEFFLNKINKWSLGQEYFRLDGSVPPEVRQKWCREFNAENNYKTKLFLISTRAGCLGLNMVAANRVIILDTSWNPAHDIQSIFRVYRFGQKKDCYIYRLVALGTMEQKIYERSVTKQAVACRVVDEQQIDRHYNMAELTELYRYDDTGTAVKAGVAASVSDVVLRGVARAAAGLHAAHEHDSLLRGSSEQGLPEHERHALWEQFQQEQTTRQMQNKLISSFNTEKPNSSMIVQNDQNQLPNFLPDIKTEPSVTPTVPPAVQKISKKKKKKGKQNVEPIQEPIAQETNEVLKKPHINEEEIVVKILNELVKFSPRIEASIITEIASNVKNIIAQRKMPEGYEAKLTKIINEILNSYFPPMPALTDINIDSTKKKNRSKKNAAEMKPEVAITPNLEMPSTSRSARLSARQNRLATTYFDQDYVHYQDDDYNKSSETDTASEKDFDNVITTKKKSKTKSEVKAKPNVNQPPPLFTEKKYRKNRSFIQNMASYQPIDQSDSILLSDVDEPAEHTSNKKTIVPEPKVLETEVPLHPSLLANQNFIKIVAHTYLEGNQMLDEDAATLAAKYSTDKALKEFEKTGKSITSGPIYDIAKKVLGIEVLMKLNENDPPVQSTSKTETRRENKKRPTQSNEPQTNVAVSKRSKSSIKPKVISELMPSEANREGTVKTETTPKPVISETPIAPQLAPVPATLAQPVPAAPAQIQGPNSAKAFKTTMFTVRSGMSGSSTVIPIGLIQNPNINTDGPEESILPDDDVSIISDVQPPPTLVRNNSQPLVVNRLIAAPKIGLTKDIRILNSSLQKPLVSTNFGQPFIMSGPNVFAITTRPDTYGVVGNLTMMKPAATPVKVTSAIQTPTATVSTQIMSDDVVCLDSDEEITPVVEPKAKRTVAVKSTTKQSVSTKQNVSKDTPIPGNSIKIINNQNKRLTQVPTSMVPPAILVGHRIESIKNFKPTQTTTSTELEKTAQSLQKNVPLPLCKPGNILRLTKSGNVEILSKVDDEVTIIDDEPNTSVVIKNAEGSLTSAKKVGVKPPEGSKVTNNTVNTISSTNQHIVLEPPERSKVTPNKRDGISKVTTPEKVQSSPSKNLVGEPKKCSKPQTTKRSKRVISSSDSSQASSRSPSPESNDPLAILRDVVHIRAPDDEATARVEPLKLQRVDNQFKTVTSKENNTVGSTTITTSPDSKKKTTPSVLPDDYVLKIKRNVSAGKPSYVIQKGSRLSEAVAEAIKKMPTASKPEIIDASSLAKTNKHVILNISGKTSIVTGKTSTVTGKTSTVTGKTSTVTGKSSTMTGKSSAVTGKSSTVTGKTSNDSRSSKSAQVTSRFVQGTSKYTEADKLIKRRTAPAPSANPPKKKKTEMTLKDFNIDDIDDIIELE